MKKKELNQLASKYRRNPSDTLYKVIYNVVKPMSHAIRAKYNIDYIRLTDFESVERKALWRSLETYKPSKGSFSNHYMRRLSSDFTREAIKMQPGIRLTEDFAKKDFQLCSEAKALMIRFKDDKEGYVRQELKDIYNLTDIEYDNLLHYYTQVPLYMSDYKVSDYIDNDLKIDVPDILDHIDVEYRKPVVFYFGLFGNPCLEGHEIKKYYGVEEEELLAYLSGNEELKKLIGDYDEC